MRRTPARFRRTGIARLAGAGGRAIELHVAAGAPTRLLGLAWLEADRAERGLLIPRCSSIHTLGMRFALDVVFVGWPPAGGRVHVLGLRERLPPRRQAACRGGRSVAVAELLPGSIAALDITTGSELMLELPASRAT
jgi:uncharacterized protein